MNGEPATHNCEVVYIFCSTRTRFSNLGLVNLVARPAPAISLVRCQWCGKEAQYQAKEIISLRAAS